MSFLHFLRFVKGGRRPEPPGLDDRRRPGVPRRRRHPPDLRADGRRARRPGPSSTPSSAPISQDDDGVRVDFEGGEVTGRQRHRDPAADAGRPDPLRAAAPGHAGRTDPADPRGSRDQGAGRLRDAVLARAGLNGFALSLDDDFNVVLDNSPPDGSCGVLVGFFEGAHAPLGRPATPTERRQLVVDTLVKYFGPEAAEPFDYLEKDWAEEEFTRGCYGGRLGAGVWTQYGKALAAPDRPHPLGRLGDRRDLEQLHGRGDQLRPPRRRRGPRRL